MWVMYNPNPGGRQVGDCAVRAVTKALGLDWESAYVKLMKTGYLMRDMPSSDSVWGELLKQNGFRRYAVNSGCPYCYTATDFCREHPKGIYVLGFGGHCATVINGDLFDSWDSSNELPQYYWMKEE